MKNRAVGILFASMLILTSNAMAADSGIGQAVQKPNFQPGVEDFIHGSYFQHKTELPNPNESVEVLKSYMHLKGSPEELEGFQELVKKFPDSKHAHNGLAMAYYDEFRQTKDKHVAQSALNEELIAAKITYSYGDVLYVDWIRQMALDAGQLQLAIHWFQQLLLANPTDYEVNLQYAKLLSTTDKTKSESLFQKSIDARPVGNLDAPVAYAEFLIDNGRYADALNNSVLVGERAFYLDFLHGYALEKQGKGSEAVRYYQKFADMSKSFPAPYRYQIPNSQYQQGITFNTVIGGGGQSVAQYNLSYVTACEASTESIGGQRQVAWSVRQRVNRGTIANCLSVNNSGSTMDDKYSNVICQPGQYASVTCSSGSVSSCTNSSTKNSTSDQVAYDVYNGDVPDPFTDYCPGGSDSGFNSCTDSCSGTNVTAYHNTTPHSFLSYSHSEPTCFLSAGAVCGNGSPDNYFDYSN